MAQTARQAFAAALREAGYLTQDARNADLVRQFGDRFIILHQSEDEEGWCVSRFYAHGKRGDYDGCPIFEHEDRDAAAEVFLSAS